MFYVLDFSVLFCLEIPYLEVHLIIDVKLNYVDIFIEGMLFFHFVFIMMYKGQLISLVFLSKWWNQKDILKLTDL